MRFLAVLLLLANVGLFAWIYTQPVQQPPAYRPVPVLPGIEPLILLAERQSQNPPNEPLTEEVLSDEEVPDEVEEVLSDERAPDQAEEVLSDEQAPDQAEEVLSDEQAADQAEEVLSDEQAPDQVDVVLTEVSDLQEVVIDAVEEVLSPEPPERICQTIGPLMKSDDVNQIARQLETQGFEARQRNGKVREPSGYWVYLPAMPAADARRIVSELDSKGMTDYFIGKRNYISLGIFRRKDQAQVRLEQVTALGYDPILDQRYRTRTVHWLDIEEAGQPLLASSIWQQIQAQHTDIRVQRVSCE